MLMPTTYEECDQRARVIATEEIRAWEESDWGDVPEGAFLDTYSHELKVLLDLMGDRNGNSISNSAYEPVRHCRRMRVETDEPSPLGIAVDAVIRAASGEVMGDRALARKGVIASAFRNLFATFAFSRPLHHAVITLMAAAESELKADVSVNSIILDVLNALAATYGADRVRELISEMA